MGAVIHCTVERKLSERYSSEPVQTVLMAKHPYYLLDSSVVSLHLPIHLWMIGRYKDHFTAHDFSQFFPEHCGESWVTVVQHIMRYIKETDDIVKK